VLKKKLVTNDSFIESLTNLWGHINLQRRLQIWLLFALMVSVSILEVIGIGAVLPFLSVLTAPERLFQSALLEPYLSHLGIANPDDLLLPISIIFALLSILSGCGRILLLWAFTRIAAAVGADLSSSAYRRTLYQSYSVHIGRNSSVVISGVSGKTSAVVGRVLMPILVIMNAFIMFFMIITSLLLIEAATALYAFFSFALMYIVIILITKKQLRLNGERVGREATQVQKALQEGLGGIRDILLDGTQEVYFKIYQEADRPMRRADANIQIIGGSPRFLVEACGMVIISLLAYTLAQRPEGIYTALPLLGAIALSAQRLLPILQQSYASWTLIRSSRSTLFDALELLNQPLPERSNNSVDSISFNNEIKIINLSYRYESSPKLTIDNISLSIKKGEKIGIIGTTGSGKSTFLDILMALLEPTDGKISIDGQELTPQNGYLWQKHISHVPQFIYLADAPIYENIAFGIPRSQVDMSRVIEAARNAQIDSVIESWQDGYQTLVGERGIRLSGGQRQRIGIARALYKRANVIIFDEATSSLDTQTESAVMDVINNLSDELTVVIVAHRLTTLKDCTKIIQLDNGVIKRIGNYIDIVKD
jgi:ABC-type multidrug transport system fused ATPase/permease subunit